MQRLLAEAGGDVSKASLFESHTFASAKNPGMLWPREVPYTITREQGTTFCYHFLAFW